MQTLTILSNKGGVGKTFFAVNLAIQLAKTGKRVSLLDGDVQGPSLMTYLEPKGKYLNDYLFKDAAFEECTQNYQTELNLDTPFFVVHSNPSADAIEDILNFNEPEAVSMLQRLIKIKKILSDEPYNTDYLIIDSSPGLSFTTLNLTVLANVFLFVVKVSNADLFGTAEMIKALRKYLKFKTFIVANQVPTRFFSDSKRKDDLSCLVKEKLRGKVAQDLSFLGWLPIDMDLLEDEFEGALDHLLTSSYRREIFSLTRPSHHFSISVAEISQRLFEE